MTELVCHLRPVRGPYPLQEPGLPQKKILGMEQEVMPGMAGRRALPLSLNTALPGGAQNQWKMKRFSWIMTWKLCQS